MIAIDHLKPGIVRACGGLIEACNTEPYITAIANAGRVVGQSYGLSDEAQQRREELVKAIKLNLINRKEYPFDLLQRKFDLPISNKTFGIEKIKFCQAMAKELNLI